MVEIIPFLLFLLEWSPDRPADIVLTRHEVVYIDEAACNAAGHQMMAEATNQEIDDAAAEGRQRSFSCQPLPPREEFNAMMEREFGEGSE